MSNPFVPVDSQTWAEFYQQGGAVMHAILLIAVVGFAVVLERCWWLRLGLNTNVPKLMALVQGCILAGDTAAALRLCAGHCYIERVVRAGLMAGVDPVRAQSAVEEEQMLIVPSLRRFLPSLATLASLAMLVGLLGTTFGMISGFGCLATVSAAQRAGALAMHISVAVHSTGFGILVGILLLSARLVLHTVAEKLVAQVALSGAKVVNLVRVIREPLPSGAAPYR
ncbi:MAG: MotA/TolQ/ExbB proton channel family protein [Nannocystales bacterium]